VNDEKYNSMNSMPDSNKKEKMISEQAMKIFFFVLRVHITKTFIDESKDESESEITSDKKKCNIEYVFTS
jgi:hypothetical protein